MQFRRDLQVGFGPGSTIVACTDGLANIGVGRLDLRDKDTKFYTEAADLAKKLGVTVNNITLKGSECDVEALGVLCDKTNGQILRISSSQVDDNMDDIFADQVIATGVNVSLQLAQGVGFETKMSACLTR